MSEEASVSILRELEMIRSLLERQLRDTLRRDLEAIATTKERRAMWILIDGQTNTDEISKKIKVSQRAVQIFVKELLDADMVSMERRGYPKRRFDYIPSSWRVEENGD